MGGDDINAPDRYNSGRDRESELRSKSYDAEESTQTPEPELEDRTAVLPPSYAESVHTPSPAPQNSTAYSSGKASFAPSVSFGENTEGEYPRPLPFPSVRSELLPSDEKAPEYEEFTVEQAEVQISDEVPVRLSQIEVTMSPAPGVESASKPLYHVGYSFIFLFRGTDSEQNLMSLLLMEVSPVNNTTTNRCAILIP